MKRYLLLMLALLFCLNLYAQDQDQDLSLDELADPQVVGKTQLSPEEAEDLEIKDKDEAVSAEMDGQMPPSLAEADELAAPVSVDEIPIYSNKKIEAFVAMYTGRKRDVFEQAVERSATYLPMIRRIFAEEGLPPNLAFLSVVESNFNPQARSRASALGLWQFMSYTGRMYGLSNSWWHDERYDPEKSTRAAAKYLKNLYREFGDWELALAAYNSGSGRVRGAIKRAVRLGKDQDFWALKLPRETRGYVPAFYAVNILFANLEAYGFNDLPEMLEEKPRYPLEVPGGVTLAQISEVIGIDEAELQSLNPSIPKGLTPAHHPTYVIMVPRPIEPDQEKLNQLEQNRTRFWKYHQVQKGDNLWSISREYGVPIAQIISFNQISRGKLLRLNQRIMLPVSNSYVLPQYSRVSAQISAPANRDGFIYHTVQRGDSLWSISQAYKVTIHQIKAWNYRAEQRWRHLRPGEQVAVKLPQKETNTL
ncbi:MAG: hypothetical protein A2527_06415 [Candidatus Lambdaproteobacteria bacterium RIFOXYD2_FULL_50_16]|uniref:LysM domain-containing protein n=1 Tax=Candidatus Lambdaproteobacteria bacterium RIFOXYD2_FULL_50_16 TaxID=1817772 RepID=A0A1F6GA39_9PROT|nr:MAG: hypothetical protein A2527_06415 [Candidatus Lambdaproteobacteria bacterium RIFOXYD2_FULL_50_16]